MSDLLSTQTLLALSFVGSLVGTAFVLSRTQLREGTSSKSKNIFVWLAFDCLCHLTLEGSFLYLSTFGRTINASNGFFATLWKDYARADARWGLSDPTVVSLEILTVLGAGPLAGYCAYLISVDDPIYHFWVVVLSVAELYGGFMTFAPEWLTGNKFLNGSDFLLMWVYLFFMNMAWVVIPFYLIYDSYVVIAANVARQGSLYAVAAAPASKSRSKKRS